ncbi:hypothetical protein AcV5_009433 [Taiwanofungus camphoratus]|nr:hypothetical protein AcV5_009433 [Antrodia cinnamomea]
MAQGDRVRIISGKQTGLQGHILTLTDGIAEIGLDTVDIRGEDVAVNIVLVPLGCLQRHFKVGDNMVQVISGPFKGYLGYIKSVNVSTIDVEMVTPVGQLYAFSFLQLAFWSHGSRLLPLDPSIQIRSEGVGAQFPGPSTPRPSTPRPSTPRPSTPQPSTPQSSVLKLEASAESLSVLAVDPTWDPSS